MKENSKEYIKEEYNKEWNKGIEMRCNSKHKNTFNRFLESYAGRNK